MVHVFSDHAQNCAERVAPLYDMLKGTGWNTRKPKSKKIHIPGWDIKWGEEQAGAFKDVKEEPAAPEFLVPTFLGCKKRLIKDASGTGYGAVLLHKKNLRRDGDQYSLSAEGYRDHKLGIRPLRMRLEL